MTSNRGGRNGPLCVARGPSNTSTPGTRDRVTGETRELVLEGRRYRLVPLDGVSRGEREASAASLLTARELQIVALVAEGRVNKQIADALHISEWTVSTHLRRIFTKLGVDTRAAMVLRCAPLLTC